MNRGRKTNSQKTSNNSRSKNSRSNNSRSKNSRSNNSFTKLKYRREDKRGNSNTDISSQWNKNNKPISFSKEQDNDQNKNTTLKKITNNSKNNEFKDINTYSKDNRKNLISNKNNISKAHERNLDDLIWGKHAVFSILESGKSVNRIWCTAELRSSEKFFLLLKEFKKKGTLIEEVPWSRISQITLGAVHQGIALQIAYSRTISLPDMIDSVKTKYSNPTLVMLDGITDPHNLGAIIRSAEAFGCSGIIIPQRRSAGLTGTVAKVAAGALDHIPVSRVINLSRTLEELKNQGFTVAGLSLEGNLDISAFNDKGPLVIVIGSEGKGLSLLIQRNCDILLKIPMKGKTSSLNAAVAAAISFHHISIISKNLISRK